MQRSGWDTAGAPFLMVSGAFMRGVDFSIRPGEVVGLVGHNGAGKSTLMNLLAGTVQRSSGTFRIGETEVEAWSPHSAQARGLRCVFQELSFCGNLTLTENTWIIHRALKGFGWRRRAATAIRSTLDAIFPGHGIAPNARVSDLPIGARQMVEIARAYSETDVPVRCVILDEPTSALGHDAANQLLAYIRKAAGRGVAAILITHRLDEIMGVCDRAVVMVDGVIVAERSTAGLTRAELVMLMGTIEAPRDRERATRSAAGTEGALMADHPERDPHDLPIRATAGDIIGFAELDGHGQRERLCALYAAGRRGSHPVAYVAGDRGTEGIFALCSGEPAWRADRPMRWASGARRCSST